MPVFRRLLGFLRPYRSGVIASFALAACAMGVGILIPPLIGKAVDDISDGGDSLGLIAAAIVGAGLLRLLFSVVRRLVAGRVSLGVEFDLRNLLYGHLQSLELGFFDGQQTGQLMSRATVDLQAVRFFLGYGLIFMAQAALTIVIAAGVMIFVNPLLALVALAPMPWVVWVAFRYGRLNRPASQEVQQRIAELTAAAEENVSGVRVVKALRPGAPPDEALPPLGRARLRPVDGLDPAARLLQPLHRLPAAARPGGDRAGRRAPGRSTARSASATSSPSTATC